MIDAAQQRMNMVDSQVLTSDVTDWRILRALRELPREQFVPAAYEDLAYMDEAVPPSVPGAGEPRRWLVAPRVLARERQTGRIDVGGPDACQRALLFDGNGDNSGAGAQIAYPQRPIFRDLAQGKLHQ